MPPTKAMRRSLATIRPADPDTRGCVSASSRGRQPQGLDLLLHAFGILCGLSLTVLATFAARPAGAVALGAGFALAWIALPRGIVPDPVWFGLLLAAGAALGLWARGSL